MIIQGSMRYSPSGRRRKTTAWKKKKGAVAQMGERRTCTAKVAGSNPVSSTMHGKAILLHSPKVIVHRRRIACS